MKKLIASVLMIPCMAMAEFKTGNELLSNMNSDNVVENMVALGYVMGVADATRGTGNCGPETATAGQMRDLVKNYLIANPQFRHYSADVIVMAILGKTWPCPNKKGTGV